jgi:hypothetical protein
MIRARAAFAVSRYAKTGYQSSSGHNQIYSEDEISEDIELGARIHAAGYKSVFIAERLATGEVRSPSPCRTHHSTSYGTRPVSRCKSFV